MKQSGLKNNRTKIGDTMKMQIDNIEINSHLSFREIREIYAGRSKNVEIVNDDVKKIIARTERDEVYKIRFNRDDIIRCMEIWPDYSCFMEMPEKFNIIPDRNAAEKWIERYIRKDDNLKISLTQIHSYGVQYAILIDFSV